MFLSSVAVGYLAAWIAGGAELVIGALTAWPVLVPATLAVFFEQSPPDDLRAFLSVSIALASGAAGGWLRPIQRRGERGESQSA